MRRGLSVFLGVFLMLIFVSCAFAAEKAKLGPCVRECVQAFNPSLADSGADTFTVDDFRAKECVEYCKETTFEGACYYWQDDCCNIGYVDSDPDCDFNLPPDPGEVGKLTVAGIDSDNDGVRDDVQRFIIIHFQDSQKTRAALEQISISFQKAMVESTDAESAHSAAEKMARSIECLYAVRPEEADEVSTQLKAEILNTVERSKAYIEFNGKLAGKVVRGRKSSEFSSSCTFDPSLMED